MTISDEQLDEYIALYKKEFGEDLERGRVLMQLRKLLNLVMYMAYPELTVQEIDTSIE